MSITLVIIIITTLTSFYAFNNARVMNDFMFLGHRVRNNKEYIRFISSGFIHADFQHLFFNMFSFYFFGSTTEWMFERIFPTAPNVLFLLFYLSALAISEIPSYIKNKNNYQYASLGASGAVAAVIYANIFFDPFGMMSFYFIPMPKFVFGIFYIMICIYMDRQRMDNVNHSAHLWGAVYGFFFPLLVQPNLIHFFIGHFGYAMN